MLKSLLTSKNSDPSTPDQVRDVRNITEVALEHGGFSKAQLQYVHENGDRYKAGFQEFIRNFTLPAVYPEFALEVAIELLGAGKVVSCEQHCTAFGQEVPHGTLVVCPTLEQLQQAAEENKSGNTDWRVVYVSALSFPQQRQIVGTDSDNQPCFYDQDWYLEDSEKAWANGKPEAGYYLVDFKGRWNSTNWQGQEDKITALGEDYERADERVFSQGLLSIFKISGQRLFENDYHWGRTLGSDGDRVFVGLFDSGGLVVGHVHPSRSYSILWVCVARKSSVRCLVA